MVIFAARSGQAERSAGAAAREGTVEGEGKNSTGRREKVLFLCTGGACRSPRRGGVPLPPRPRKAHPPAVRGPRPRARDGRRGALPVPGRPGPDQAFRRGDAGEPRRPGGSRRFGDGQELKRGIPLRAAPYVMIFPFLPK